MTIREWGRRLILETQSMLTERNYSSVNVEALLDNSPKPDLDAVRVTAQIEGLIIAAMVIQRAKTRGNGRTIDACESEIFGEIERVKNAATRQPDIGRVMRELAARGTP